MRLHRALLEAGLAEAGLPDGAAGLGDGAGLPGGELTGQDAGTRRSRGIEGASA
jgi:hypothetical protein